MITPCAERDRPYRPPTPKEINQRNRAFWRKKRRAFEWRIEDPDVIQRAIDRMQYDTILVVDPQALLKPDDITRNQKSLESCVEAVWPAISRLRKNRAQRQRARLPRIKIDDDVFLQNLISDLALSAENLGKQAIELWGPFKAILKAWDLDPRETAQGEDRAKWFMTYRYDDHDRHITFGRFRNIVSEARRKNSR